MTGLARDLRMSPACQLTNYPITAPSMLAGILREKQGMLVTMGQKMMQTTLAGFCGPLHGFYGPLQLLPTNNPWEQWSKAQ